MKKQHLTWVLAVAAGVVTMPVTAQHEERAAERPQSHEPSRPRANQGHIPAAPVARTDRTLPGRPEVDERHRINSTPHVNHNEWYGHDRPDDPRFHLDHPFAHGRFAHFGPNYRYSVVRIDPSLRRLWLPGGFFFEVAPFDWALAAEWCWNCGDDFVIYEDSDHPGWYLLYNAMTGAYVHVQYMGT